MFKKQVQIPKELREKIKEEEKRNQVTELNSFEKVADNVLLVFKHQTSTIKAFGTLFRLESTTIDGTDEKEETYALYTDKKNWIIFRKRLHKYHDLKSELDDKKLIEIRPEASLSIPFLGSLLLFQKE